MPSPIELVKKLEQQQIFKNWQIEHQEGFLSHAFASLDKQGELINSWEIGYFDPKNQKITIFIYEKDIWKNKPEDDVFKQPQQNVEHLIVDKIKISFIAAVATCKDQLPRLFPKQQPSKGFVILQTLQQKTLWNFTFVTSTLQLINIKINAATGDVEQYQNVELIKK